MILPYMDMAAILIIEPSINRRLYVKFEEGFQGRSRSKVWTDGRTTDYGRGVITTAHPEPSAQVS